MNRIIQMGLLRCLKNIQVEVEMEVCLQSTHLQDPDTGSEFTVKEYESRKTFDEDGWSHKEIVLKPRTNEEGYDEIVLKEDEITNLSVLGVLVRVLSKFL